MRSLFFGSWAVAACGAALLALSRTWIHRRGDRVLSAAVDAALLAVAMLTAGSVLAGIIAGLVETRPEGRLGPIGAGLALGVAFAAIRWAIAGAELVHRWVTRRPLERGDSRVALRMALIELAAFCAAGVVLLQAVTFASSAGLPFWLALPVLVALYPVFEQVGLAHGLLLQVRLSPHLSTPELARLQQWVEALAVS